MEKNELTLEKAKVYERLVMVEAALQNVTERLDRHGKNDEAILGKINSYMDKMDHIVIGNGKPGMVGDVHFLKEEAKERKEENKNNSRLVKATGLGLICKILYDGFFHIK